MSPALVPAPAERITPASSPPRRPSLQIDRGIAAVANVIYTAQPW